MEKIDLAGNWDKLWNSLVSGGGATFTTGLGMIGVAVVLTVLLIAVINKMRGKGSGLGGMTWALIIGAICSAPTVVVPLILKLIDLIINLAIALIGNFT